MKFILKNSAITKMAQKTPNLSFQTQSSEYFVLGHTDIALAAKTN